MNTQEISFTIKEQLVKISEKLPVDQRDHFISGVIGKLEQLSHQYGNTLLYAAVGWVLGEILEHFATVPIINLELLDGASGTGALLGGLLGFFKDRKTKAKEEQQAKEIAAIVQDELRKAVKA